MALKLIVPPAADSITLDECKMHLVVEHDEHDSLIEIYRLACQGHIDGPDGYLGRSLIDTTWDLILPRFPGRHRHWQSVESRYSWYACHPHIRDERPHEIEIRPAPLIEVLGVFYLDANGDEQTMDPALYFVADDNDLLLPGRIVLASGASWPVTALRPDAVRIRFRAGYLDQTDSPAVDKVPFPIKAAMLLHVGDLYKNRETTLDVRAVAKLPWAADQLLLRYNLNLSLA